MVWFLLVSLKFIGRYLWQLLRHGNFPLLVYIFSLRLLVSLTPPLSSHSLLLLVAAQNSSADATSQYVVALYTYSPHQDSPNEFPELELEFLEGDIIKVGSVFVGHIHGVCRCI